MHQRCLCFVVADEFCCAAGQSWHGTRQHAMPGQLHRRTELLLQGATRGCPLPAAPLVDSLSGAGRHLCRRRPVRACGQRYLGQHVLPSGIAKQDRPAGFYKCQCRHGSVVDEHNEQREQHHMARALPSSKAARRVQNRWNCPLATNDDAALPFNST